jgi:hypothetical protein
MPTKFSIQKPCNTFGYKNLSISGRVSERTMTHRTSALFISRDEGTLGDGQL